MGLFEGCCERPHITALIGRLVGIAEEVEVAVEWGLPDKGLVALLGAEEIQDRSDLGLPPRKREIPGLGLVVDAVTSGLRVAVAELRGPDGILKSARGRTIRPPS